MAGAVAPVFFSGGPHRTGPPSTITKIKNKDMDSKINSQELESGLNFLQFQVYKKIQGFEF